MVSGGRVIAAALVATTILAATSACARTESCVSWVWFDTPQAAYDDARLVVRGEVGEVVGARDLFGVDAPVHTVEILDVLKGDDPGGAIDVAATPITCTGDDDHPDGEALDVEGEVILFLFDHDGGWRLVTPTQGVLPVPPDGVLPFDVGD